MVFRRGISVNFMVDIWLDFVVDLDLFKYLYRVGLCWVFIGVEIGFYE